VEYKVFEHIGTGRGRDKQTLKLVGGLAWPSLICILSFIRQTDRLTDDLRYSSYRDLRDSRFADAGSIA